MSKLSFLDKLEVLINLSSSTYVIILAALLIFGVVLSFTNKKNEQLHRAIYVVVTAVIIGILIASYHSSLGNMFSYMMNNFFIAVYFPTIAIYLAAIIAMNIIVWISVFSYKSSKQIRALNISVYVIMNYILALLLKVINSNKLDIFDQASLYGNKDATALIELSSIIFMVWVIFLVLYKIILIYIKKEYKPKVKRVIIRKKIKKLPENFEPTLSPSFVYGKAPHKETLIIKTNEKTEDELLLEQFSKQFTLDDYKLFSKLLKEEQERTKKEEVKEKKKKDKKVEFIKDKDYKKVSKKIKQQEIIVSSANVLEEEDNYRELQKQEIIRMEEERRELLRKEQEKQKAIEEQQKREKKQQEKEAQALELLIKQSLDEKEREQRKLTELEMLYR